MQTDQSIDSATATSRRTFLIRTAAGGALVTAGALALPLGPLVGPAGARRAAQGTLSDAKFAAFATPLELAAVSAYTAAFDSGQLDDEWSAIALDFQSHHQAVADTLTTLIDPDAETPVVDAAFAKQATDAIAAASDQNATLLALSNIEDILAATHLVGVGRMEEKSTAKTVAQVLAVEGQQAAFLAVGGGGSIEDATPATSNGDAALSIPGDTATSATTTVAN